MTDLLTPEPRPLPSLLEDWAAAARSGAGSPWLSAAQAEALARYALAQGEGVHLMEAAAYTLHEPPRDIGWEILGADPQGENWDDHRDPVRAFALLRQKLTMARRNGARLQYKLWLRTAGT